MAPWWTDESSVEDTRHVSYVDVVQLGAGEMTPDGQYLARRAVEMLDKA